MSETEPRPTQRKRGRGANVEETKRQLLKAAFDSLRDAGFKGTTARSISQRASCNQAAIYYHFGSIEALLLASLEKSSTERLANYKTKMGPVTDPAEILALLGELYTDDQASGHLKVLTELAGGITTTTELRDGIQQACEPWLNFVELKVGEVLEASPLSQIVSAEDLADLIFTIVFGMEIRSSIDGNTDRTERILGLAQLATAFLPK